MDGLVRSLAIGIGWNVDNKQLNEANQATDDLVGGANRAEKEVDQLGKSGEKAGNKLTRGFKKANKQLKSGLGVLNKYKYELTAAAAVGVTGMYQLAKQAGDAQETVNKFRVVFGSFAGESRGWAKNYSDQIGRSEYATLNWLNSFQDVLVPMGLARDEAGGLSQEMVTLAADLGSFNNVPTADAARAMQSALVGNHEAVRMLGIQLSASQLDLVAQREGYKKNFAQLDNLSKMQLRFQEMIRQSSDAVGDATRTADEFNNQQLALKGNLRDTAVAMGNQYIPTMNNGLIAVNKFLDAFQESEWVGPTARLAGIGTGLAVVGAAAAWLGGSGLLAVGGFAIGVGLLALAIEDVASYFSGRDSFLGDFITFVDEMTALDAGVPIGLNFEPEFGFPEEPDEETKRKADESVQAFADYWTKKLNTGFDKLGINIDGAEMFPEFPEFGFPEFKEADIPDVLTVEWWQDRFSKEWEDFKGFDFTTPIQESWDDFKDDWSNFEWPSWPEFPDLGLNSFIDEQLDKLPDNIKGIIGLDDELEQESKNIQQNNSNQTNVNDNSVNVEKGAINIQGATDPKAVGKEVKKTLNSYMQIQAGEVGAN